MGNVVNSLDINKDRFRKELEDLLYNLAKRERGNNYFIVDRYLTTSAAVDRIIRLMLDHEAYPVKEGIEICDYRIEG